MNDQEKIEALLNTDVFRMLKIVHYIEMLRNELDFVKKENVAADVWTKTRELVNQLHGFKLRLKQRDPNFAKMFTEIEQEKLFAMMTINSIMINMELSELLKLEDMFEYK